MAQTIVLDQRPRQGTHTSSSLLVPSTGLTLCRVQADINAADLASTKSFRCWLEQSVDNGQTWQHRFGFGFQGPMTEQPYMEFSVVSLLGTRVRVIVDIPVSIRMGAIIDLT